MTPPIHYLHIRQKPALGNAFIKRFPVYNYTHSINAIGGFDDASFDVVIRSKDEGQEFLDQYLGNRVAIYADDPIEPIWEGLINTLSFNSGVVEYRASLDEMANSVIVAYQAGTANTTTYTTVVNDTASVNIYGLKQIRFDMGWQAGVVPAMSAALRDTKLAQVAWPKTSYVPSAGNPGLLHVGCLGFWHTLDWEYLNVLTNVARTFTAYMTTDLLPSMVNTIFFDTADFTAIQTNSTLMSRQQQATQTVSGVLHQIQECGDGTSYWTIGISPTDFRTGTRRLYYQLASTTIAYTARQSDGLRIRNLYGQLVEPWRVRPDAGLRISDMLTGWNGVGDNPTEMYIFRVDYDANAQQVTVAGDDDATAEGAFQFRRYNQPYGKRFGQVRNKLA